MKKLHIIGAAVLAGTIIAGCNKDEEKKPATDSQATAAAAAKDPNEVLITVNGKKLTRGELESDVEKIAKAQGDKVPADQQEYMRQMVRNQLAGQFVHVNALEKKAKELGLAVTDADRKAREDDIIKAAAGRPDAPKSFAELEEKFPLGKDRMREMLDSDILFSKMLAAETAKSAKTDYGAEAKKIIDEVVSNNNAQASADAEALAKIKALKVQLDDPAVTNVAAKFAELAKANSACPSKEQGGDLREFTRGMMVKEFDAVAFTQPVGKVSEPVKTEFGYHLILVTEKTPKVEAKGDKPEQPEKVRASHILIKGGATRPVPKAEDVIKMLKGRDERTVGQQFIKNVLRESKIEVVEEFKQLLPPPEEPAPAAKPAPVASDKK